MLMFLKRLKIKKKLEKIDGLTEEIFNKSYINHPVWDLEVEVVYKKRIFGRNRISKLGETKISKFEKIKKIENELLSMKNIKGARISFENFGSLDPDITQKLVDKGLVVIADPKELDDFDRVKKHYHCVYNGDDYGYYLIDNRLAALNCAQ